MALKPVSDPALLAQLNGSAPAGRKPVTDPTLLAQLDAPDQPQQTDPRAAFGEAALNIGTGMLAAPVAGVAGIGTMAGRMLGFTDAQPADVVENVQNAMTFQPRTQAGQSMAGAITYPLRKLAEAGDVVGDQANAPRSAPRISAAAANLGLDPMQDTRASQGERAVTGALANTAVQALPSLLTRGRASPARSAEAPRAAPKAVLTPEQTAVSTAKEAGFKLLPSQEGKTVGALAEGLTGQAKLERSLSKQNAKVVDRIAAEEIGLPKGTPVTRAAIEAKRKEASQPYREVSKLGQVKVDQTFRQEVQNIGDRSGAASFAEDTPAGIANLKGIYGAKEGFAAADAVAKVRQLRADATSNLKARNAPEQNAMGQAQRQLAEAIDNQLERHAAALGMDDLVGRYRAARVQLAKLHTVENALRGTNVSAKVLAQQQRRGVPLSGGLKTIADTFDSFDRVLQDVSKIRDGGPLGVVDYLIGAGASFSNPALAAAALTRPIVRAGLASDRYQRGGVPSPRASGVAKESATRALAAASGASERRNQLIEAPPKRRNQLR